MTDSETEGWKVVQRKEVDLKGLPRAQREKEEDRYIRDWDKTPGNWSGLGKHITGAKHIHVEIETHLEADDPLGNGAFGQVDAVSYRHVSLARKRVARRTNLDELRAEAHVMERLDHPHIVRVVGSYSYRRYELFLLLWPVAVCTLAELINDLEYLREGTGDRNRDDMLKRMRALDLRDPDAVDPSTPSRPGAVVGATGNCPMRFLQKIMGCLAQALAHVHEADVRHLDLKPSNILLSPDRVYIADFGISRGLNDGEATMTLGGRGTNKWRAPETWDLENQWSMQAVDVYALGLVYLAISTVLYRSPYAHYEKLLSEDPVRRPSLLAAHIAHLAPLALASPLLLPHASKPDTIATPRPVLELTSRMLSPDASLRPRARDVDVELAVLGGIEQVYHGAGCCRKSNTFVALHIDETHGAACAEGRRLKTENEKLVREVEALRRANEVYAVKADKDKRAMMARVADEVGKRKALDDRVTELERLLSRTRRGAHANGQPQPQPRGRGLGLQHGVKVNGVVRVNGVSGAVNGTDTVCGPSKSPSIPRPQAQPIQRIRSNPLSQLRPPSEPAQANAPLHTPPSSTATLSASYSSMLARGMTSTPTPPASSIPTKAATVPIKTSPSPSPNGYGLRSRSSTSRLPLPVTPRTSTPGLASKDPTDSTQTSISSSIFSRASLETLASPVVGTPVVRIRQGTTERNRMRDENDGRSAQEGGDDEEEEDDDDDDEDGSVLWTTLPERRSQEPPPFRTWSSVVSSAPSEAGNNRPQTPRRLPSHKLTDSLTEVPNYPPTSPGLAPFTPISPSMSAQSSPRLSRAEVASVASVSSAGDVPRGPPTLSPMKSWAEVAGDAVGKAMVRIRIPPVRGPSSERGEGWNRAKTPTQAAHAGHQQQQQQQQHPNRRVMPAMPMTLSGERTAVQV